MRDQHIIRVVLAILSGRRFVQSECVFGGLCCSVENKPKWNLSNGQFVISRYEYELAQKRPLLRLSTVI